MKEILDTQFDRENVRTTAKRACNSPAPTLPRVNNIGDAHRVPSSWLKAGFAVILPLILSSACTNTDDVSQFAKAARAVSTAATTGYKQFNTDYADASRDSAIINGKQISRESMQRILDQKTRAPARLNALDQLGQYATALEALATKDPTPDIQQAAGDLKTNLTALNASVAKLGGKSSILSANDIGIISGAAAVIGDAYVRARRERAIRTIVQQANPAISKIAGLLAREFRNMGETLRGELEGASSDMRDIASDPTKASVDQRLNFGRMAQKLFDDAQAAPAAYQSVADSANKMAATHTKLARAAAGGQMTTAEFVAALSDFVSQVQKTKKLFDDVSKT